MSILSGADPQCLAAAAAELAAGRLVAFPTETVYGLGARADDDAAVAGIFTAKGRPADHPLIVHLADAAAAGEFALPLGAAAQRLAAAFWPGPLTLIVPRKPGRGAAALACACRRIRWRWRCCVKLRAWGCPVWPDPAPIASAVSAQLPLRMCRMNSAKR
jgi:hypothetical protein